MSSSVSYSNYPALEISLDGIYHNSKAVVNMCKGKGIQITGVVKGTTSYENSYFEIANQMLRAGCNMIDDSRINTIKRMRELILRSKLSKNLT